MELFFAILALISTLFVGISAHAADTYWVSFNNAGVSTIIMQIDSTGTALLAIHRLRYIVARFTVRTGARYFKGSVTKQHPATNSRTSPLAT